MKKTHLVFFLALLVSASYAQEYGGPVKWMSFEQALTKQKTEKRKIFVDVYTQWCGWCKVMDAKTFSHPKVAKILNEKFYPVKLDAEQTGDIKVKEQTFKYVENGGRGVHQLAAALLNNQMSYPNFVFLDEDLRIIPVYQGSTSIPGFHKAEDFHIFLAFIGGDFYKKQNIDKYKTTSYQSPF